MICFVSISKQLFGVLLRNVSDGWRLESHISNSFIDRSVNLRLSIYFESRTKNMLKSALFGYNIWCYYFVVFPDGSCHTLNDFWIWPRTHHPGSSRRHQVLMVASRWNCTLFIWSYRLLNLWFCAKLRRNWTNLIKGLPVWEITCFWGSFVDHAPSNIHQWSALLLGLKSVSKWHKWVDIDVGFCKLLLYIKWGICLHRLRLNINRQFLVIWHCWSFEVHFHCRVWLYRWSLLSRKQSSRLLKSMWSLASFWWY